MRPVRIAAFSVPPPGIEQFQSFDPESWVVVSAMHDALIYIDAEGQVQPALAISWQQIDPLTWEMELRQGVQFHDGSPFSADDVVATFRAHREPTPSPIARGPFSLIAGADRVHDYRVRFTTTRPDAMFIHRLYLSQITSARALARCGRDGMRHHPMGTGAYQFHSNDGGRRIVLKRNRNHWAQAATVDEIHLLTIRQKEWPDRLRAGEIDAAINIDVNDASRLAEAPGIHVDHAPAALSHFFLWRNAGPLADVRVRRALNHAVHRGLLVSVTEHGNATPQSSLITAEQVGHAAESKPYVYDPELARRLLREAGFANGFTLRGPVSETSSAIYTAVREFLGRVGVELVGEVLPKTRWLERLFAAHHEHSEVGDFALCNIDNPMLHGLFHHQVLLSSRGFFSLLRDPEYDRRLLDAATSFGPDGLQKLRALDRYVRDEALLLFTVKQHVYYAARLGLTLPLPKSGHFNVPLFWGLRDEPPNEAVALAPASQTGFGSAIETPSGPEAPPDLQLLLEGTSHAGPFYLPGDSRFTDSTHHRIWQNLRASQARWDAQTSPMMRELVSQVEAKSNLASVLRSTERVAILGVTHGERTLFVNAGFARLVAPAETPAASIFGAETWSAIRNAVEREGAWNGRVEVPVSVRPAGAPDHLLVTAADARDDFGVSIGYTLVFTDIWAEEERIRAGAVRTILDHVSYGLVLCDRDLRVRQGYSRSCERFFIGAAAGEPCEGRLLTELFSLDPRTSDHVSALYMQLVEDWLPEDVALAQFPSHVQVGDRHVSLRGSVVRDAKGAVSSVLFSVLDETDLIAAQHESSRLRGAVRVLQGRDSFVRFVRTLDETAEGLLREADDGGGPSFVDGNGPWQVRARREIHNWKGVFGQFEQHDLARLLHRIEDAPLITPDHLRHVVLALDELLKNHAEIWRITRHEAEPSVAIPRSTVEDLRSQVTTAASLEDARRVVTLFANKLSERTLESLLGPIGRAVEAHAERSGKKVLWQLVGGNVRVPVALQPVIDVVPHLLRNAVDHGVETPAERTNKPPQATIRLEVRREPRGLHIVASDDGRGIDAAAVLHKAEALGLVQSPGAPDSFSRREICQFIFHPGLSTANRVSETSGRGVGLDAVAAAVRSCGGSITVESEPGLGTRFTLWLPIGAPDQQQEGGSAPLNPDACPSATAKSGELSVQL